MASKRNQAAISFRVGRLMSALRDAHAAQGSAEEIGDEELVETFKRAKAQVRIKLVRMRGATGIHPDTADSIDEILADYR